MLINFAHARGSEQLARLPTIRVVDGRNANDGITFLEFVRSPQQLSVQRVIPLATHALDVIKHTFARRSGCQWTRTDLC